MSEPTWATGTADISIVGAGWLHVLDLKFGRGKIMAYDILEPAHKDMITGQNVPETTRMNLQGAMYLLGAAKKYELLGPFETYTFTIVQPFLNHVSEYTCSREELEHLSKWLSARAEDTRSNPKFVPSVDACHFCKANGDCDAQDRFLLTQALDAFDDVTTARPKPVDEIHLGTKYALLDMITDWAAAVAKRVKDKLLAGEPVLRSDGLSYKLVDGKRGARAWVSDEEAEALLKRMRLKPEQMYKTTLHSPTQIEKLAKAPKVKKGESEGKPLIGKTQWNRLQALITQPDAAPTIALETDPRPARVARTDGFEDVPPADNADLF